ncbi:MAG TPA: M56 family metallopeptidase, partial [Longimicrobiaceae bacterium]|nr:M56 family metallopeptidase [Longimicrobiaceae bacterium]
MSLAGFSLEVSDPAFAAAVVLKATLLLAGGAAVSFVLVRRRASAAARHLVWTLTVAGLLALPLLAAGLPGWKVGAVRLPAAAAGTPVRAWTAGPAGAPDVPGRAAMAEAPRGAGPAGEPAAWTRIDAARSWLAGLGWGTVAAGLYAAGVLALLAWLALGQWGVRRLGRRAEPVADEEWTGLLRDLAWMLEVDRPVTLLRSPDATMPMTWGVRRPAILLPAEADEWPEERRRVVLLHELAHVARHDCLTQALASVACALYWFHPGAWYAARRLRVERELACDDRVLSAGTRAREYAAHLLEVARAFRPAALAAPAAVSMARPSQLESRLLWVLDGARTRAVPSARTTVLAVLVGLLVVGPLAAMRPTQGVAAHGAGQAAPQEADDPPASLAQDEGEWKGEGKEERKLDDEKGRGKHRERTLPAFAADGDTIPSVEELIALRSAGVDAQY